MGGSWAASGGSKRPAERLQPRAAWDVGPLEHLESDLVRGDRDSTRELVDGGDRLRSSAQQAPRFDPAAHRTSSRASDGEYRHAVWTDEASRSMPETQYARTDDGYVAFEVFASGPFDLLFSGNWASNVEVMWEHPSMARFLQRLGRFARVICSDKRGAALADPVPLGALPTLEQWVGDARVVMDAAASEQAALVVDAEGRPMAVLFAATCPEQTRALVLVKTFARMLRADDYPIGMPGRRRRSCSSMGGRLGDVRRARAQCTELGGGSAAGAVRHATFASRPRCSPRRECTGGCSSSTSVRCS